MSVVQLTRRGERLFVGAYVPVSDQVRLRRLAERNDSTVSRELRRAIRRYLDEQSGSPRVPA